MGTNRARRANPWSMMLSGGLAWTLAAGCSAPPIFVPVSPHTFVCSSEITIDPMLRLGPQPDKPNPGWIIGCPGSRTTATVGNRRYINLDSSDALNSVDPNAGDFADDSYGERFYIATVRERDREPYDFITGSLTVRPWIWGDWMLFRLRQKYRFDVISDDYGNYTLEFDLDTVPLNNLSNMILMGGTTFSSVNAAKTVAIKIDLETNFRDVVEHVDLHLLGEDY